MRRGRLKFRRQQVLGRYVADFFCPEAKLVVELDGSIHELMAGQDAFRTRRLEEGGLAVLRFPNEQVLTDPLRVVDEIVAACKKRVAEQSKP